ncbi:MAG: HAMP domain-containing protein [Acidimicrobiales bacterium]
MRRRLIASYLTITIVTLLALVYPLGRTFASRERDRLLRDIEQDATVVASLSEDALEGGVPPDLDQLLRLYRRDPGGRIVVVDEQGRTVADSDHPGTTGVDFTNRPEVVTALGGEIAEGSRRSETLDAELVYVAVPVASGGVVHGAVRITYPSSTLDERIEAAWTGLAAISAAVVLAVTGVGFALARLVTRPVDRLKHAAERIAAGDLAARAPTDAGAPELRELAVTFNETAARLQEVMDAQQAFVGDASHQLRTPLAALRLQLENIESAAPADLQPALASARAETARLSRISEALLSLTRSAAAAGPLEVVDAAAVARDRQQAWERWPPRPACRCCSRSSRPDARDRGAGRAGAGARQPRGQRAEVAPAGSAVQVRVVRGADAGELELHRGGRGAGPARRPASPASTGSGGGRRPSRAARARAWRSWPSSPRCGGRAELREAATGGIEACGERARHPRATRELLPAPTTLRPRWRARTVTSEPRRNLYGPPEGRDRIGRRRRIAHDGWPGVRHHRRCAGPPQRQRRQPPAHHPGRWWPRLPDPVAFVSRGLVAARRRHEPGPGHRAGAHHRRPVHGLQGLAGGLLRARARGARGRRARVRIGRRR